MAWGHIRPITIDKTKCGTADTPNHPVGIVGVYPYLATQANGGKVKNASGFDIAFFSDFDLTTQLKHETVSYNAVTGEVEYWVKIPLLTYLTNTKYYIAYGNSSITTDQSNKTDVWDSHFKLVSHGQSGLDSTVSPVTPTETGTPTYPIGQVGKCMFLENTGDFITYAVGTGNKLDITGDDITIEFWHSQYAGDEYGFIVSKPDTSSGWSPNYNQYAVYRDGPLAHLRYTQPNPDGGGDYFNLNNGDYLDGVWRHLGIVVTAASSQWFVNGASYGASKNLLTMVSKDTDLYLGRENTSGSYRAYGLKLDEFRISDIGRSSSYLTATYNNTNSPSTFYLIGNDRTISPFPSHFK